MCDSFTYSVENKLNTTLKHDKLSQLTRREAVNSHFYMILG